ncbi:hypothetical protein [Streptomyces sp. NPDC046976]|uniref:hypothetical protein n=1 Tax=Streptomyces sp. NPDC046976 TaxID=3155258 RepID=UPI0033CDE7B4
MSRLSSPTGVRVARRVYHVRVESATARDDRISFRALGLLTYLLDQKEGWQVRSAQLSSGEGREGREAIRTALRELARKGYYRLERRRLRSGKVVMGTAVAEYSVPQWVADHAIFSTRKDPSVPVIEQEDGTFLVEYPDGTLGSDGFEPPPYDDVPPTPVEEESPAPVEEEPAPEEDLPVPPKKRRPRRTPAQKAADDEAKAAKAAQKAAEKKVFDDGAEKVAKWWWEHAEKYLGPYVGDQRGYIAMRMQVRSALLKGYTQKECAKALQEARVHWPSRQQWQTALGVVTNHIQPKQPGGRIAYSDSATWGPTSEPGNAPGVHAADDSDDATFGVVSRSQGE